MTGRILLVGEDDGLMYTRTMLLSDWESVIVDSRKAVEAIRTQRFDLIIIAQSVRLPAAQELIALAKSFQRPPAILAIRFPEDSADLGSEVHLVNNADHPKWLRATVARLLDEQLGS